MSQNELVYKLKTLEAALSTQEQSVEQLKKVVEELSSVVKELDKVLAIHSEKQSHLFYRVEQLQREVEMLEASGEKTTSRHQDLVEKALMAFLGGLITYIFSLSSGGN